MAKRLDDWEHKTEAQALSHDTFSRNTWAQLKQVFDALRELMTPEPTAPPKRPIGFVIDDKPDKKSESKNKNSGTGNVTSCVRKK